MVCMVWMRGWIYMCDICVDGRGRVWLRRDWVWHEEEEKKGRKMERDEGRKGRKKGRRGERNEGRKRRNCLHVILNPIFSTWTREEERKSCCDFWILYFFFLSSLDYFLSLCLDIYLLSVAARCTHIQSSTHVQKTKTALSLLLPFLTRRRA